MATNENNICTCTTPEYTIILNQQGPSGRQGATGQNGFSPVIDVTTNTKDTYVLTITTAEGVITTPNLKSEPIPSGGSNGQVLTNTGLDNYAWAYLPQANTQSQGVVRLSTDEDFQPNEEGNVDDTTACTPQTVVDYINSLDISNLENIKDITNGIQIMGFENVPTTGNYIKQYFKFITESNSSNYTAQYISENWQNGIVVGSIIKNILTDYTVYAGTGIDVTRKDDGVEIASSIGNLKYVVLTSTEYAGLTPDPDTMYRLTDTNEVYLGTIPLTGGASAQYKTLLIDNYDNATQTNLGGSTTVQVTDTEV